MAKKKETRVARKRRVQKVVQKMKKNALSITNYAEAADRIWVMMDNIDNNLMKHPVVQNEKDYQLAIEAVQEYFRTLYLLIGAKMREMMHDLKGGKI